MKIFLTTLVLFVITGSMDIMVSQNISTMWEVTVDDGSDSETAKEICLHENGGFITVGGKYGDIMLIRTAEDGTTIWKKSYLFGDVGSLPSAMKPTEDGGYIITGQMVNPDNGNYYDAYLFKIDANGDSVWFNSYRFFSDDLGEDVVQTADGGYLVVGYSIDLCNDSLPAFIFKTDSAGKKMWVKIFKESVNTKFYAVEQVNGGYLVAGNKYLNDDFSDAYVLKIDDNGNIIWETTFGNQYNDAALSVKRLSDDNYIIGGESRLENTLTGDVYIAKIDTGGNVLWTNIYGGVHDDEVCSSIVETDDGGYMGVGYRRIDPSLVTRVWLLRFNQNGDTLWTQYYGVADWSLGNSIINTDDNGFAFAGVASKSAAAGDWDFYMVRLNPETVNVYDNRIYNKALSLSIYPNPFSYASEISFYLPNNGNVTMFVLDLTGNRIKTLIDKNMINGTYTIHFDASFLPPGIYFCTIEIAGKSLTKKMSISE